MAARNDSPLGSLLLFGVLLGTGYEVYKYYRAHQHAEAANMRLRIKGVHVENDGTINMDMEVLNPNSAEFSIKSVLGDLFVNNKKIAGLQMFGNYVVRNNDQETIPLLAKFISPTIMNQVVKLFQGKNMKLTFIGTINVNDKAVPLTMQYGI